MASSLPAPRNGVTIGLPLYNEERYIEATVRSAAPQCEVLKISDNASTDRSPSLCEALSSEYPNIALVRHQQNAGAWNNFRYVLETATTPYFMWLGGHDLLPPGYVERLLAALVKNPDAVMAFGSTRYIDAAGAPEHVYECDFSDLLADSAPATRTMALIRLLSDCSMLHGVFRTEALRAAHAASGTAGYIGGDHVILGQAALSGHFVYEPAVHLIRRNPHSGDTASAQFKRLHGAPASAPEEESRSRQEMQRRQYALAVATSRDDGWEGLLYRFRARYHLVSRFGRFGESRAAEGFDRLLQTGLVRASVGRLEHLLERLHSR